MGVPRGTRTPKLAALLTKWRNGRSFGEIVTALQRFVPGTHKSTLHYYEEEARCPDTVVLWGLCRVYGVPFGPTAESMVLELLGHETPPAPRPELTLDETEMLAAYAALPSADAKALAVRWCLDLAKLSDAPRAADELG